MNAHLMISVWREVRSRALPNYNELEQAGALFLAGATERFIPGQSGGSKQWYDAFNPAGAEDLLAANGSIKCSNWASTAGGSTRRKPELSGKWGNSAPGNTAAGPGAGVFNAYPLLHTTAIYQGRARPRIKSASSFSRARPGPDSSATPPSPGRVTFTGPGRFWRNRFPPA